MRSRLGVAVGLVLLCAGVAIAQLPLLDNLSRDPTDDGAYAELPWASLDKSTFPSPCLPGYCVMGFDTVSGQFDCGPCAASGGAPTPTAATPTYTVPFATPTPVLTQTPQPVTCRTVSTSIGYLGGLFKHDSSECIATPDPTATATPTTPPVTPTYTIPFATPTLYAGVTPTYTIPYATPTPQLTAAAAPCTCRTITTAVGVLGGMFADNPCACVATPAPTVTMTTSPTYTVPFATPTPQLTAAAGPVACRTVTTADAIIGGLYADNPAACVPTPAPTATMEPACSMAYINTGGQLAAIGRFCYDATNLTGCFISGVSAQSTCTPLSDRMFYFIADASSGTTISQIGLSSYSRSANSRPPGFVRQKSRGTYAVPTPNAANDGVGADLWQGWWDDAGVTAVTGWLQLGRFNATVLESMAGGGGAGTRINFASNAIGAISPTETLGLLGGKVGIGPSQTAPADARLIAQETTLGDAVLGLVSTATNDDPNEWTRQGRVQTTAAAAGTLVTLATVTGQSYLVESRILGRCVSGAGCTAGDSQACVIYSLIRNVGGALTEVSQTTDLATADASMSGTCSAAGDHAVSGTNYVIGVTGAANETVTWHATVKVHNLGS